MPVRVRGESLVIDFYYQGKRIQKAVGRNNTDNRALVEVQFRALEAAIERETIAGVPVDFEGIFPGLFKKTDEGRTTEEHTLYQWVDEYIASLDCRPTTTKWYEGLWQRLKPSLPDMPLSALRSCSEIDQLAKRLRSKGWNNTTIRSHIALLRRAFNRAFEKDLISYSIKIPFNPNGQEGGEPQEFRPFSQAELVTIIGIVDHACPHYSNLVRVLLLTGMRPGEACGLKWSDIEWQAKTIHIQRSRYLGHESRPKTRSAIRILDMLPPVEAALRDQHNRASIGELLDREYVFLSDRRYQPLYPDVLSQWWRRQVMSRFAAAGGTPRNLYTLRRTYASMSAQAGEAPAWIAESMGHRDSTITTRHYIRAIKSANHGKKFIEELGELGKAT